MELFQFTFIRNAIIASFLINIVCGMVGTFIVTRKIVLISGGISHAAFGGIGLGYMLGINPILSAIPFSLGSALLMGIISKKSRISQDTAIGILWAVGMAMGIIFIDLSPGYAPDLFSYLFGNILTIPLADIYIMASLALIVVVIISLFYKEFIAISFDEDIAKVIGIRSDIFYLLLLAVVSVSVVMLIRVVGIILVIALLTIPASICRQFTFNIKNLIVSSVLTGLVLTISGLLISYYLDFSSGAVIILLLGAVFIVSYLAKKLYTSLKNRRNRK